MRIIIIGILLVLISCNEQYPVAHFQMHEAMLQEIDYLSNENRELINLIQYEAEIRGSLQKDLATISKAREIGENSFSYIHQISAIQDSLTSGFESLDALFQQNERLKSTMHTLEIALKDSILENQAGVVLHPDDPVIMILLQLDRLMIMVGKRANKHLVEIYNNFISTNYWYNGLRSNQYWPAFHITSDNPVLTPGDRYSFKIKSYRTIQLLEKPYVTMGDRTYPLDYGKVGLSFKMAGKELEPGKNPIHGEVNINLKDTLLHIPFKSSITIEGEACEE
ncbi:MAG: hypothetical protein R3345_01070 [Fulvivirga sp.]|nr:hypothetical protein [Fulvivirga sp.]